MTDRAALRIARRLVDAAVARVEGGTAVRAPIDRRRFVLGGGAALASALLAACEAKGGPGAQRALRFAERRNEGVERWLLRHTAIDHAPRGARAAGSSFPSYHIAQAVPVWDTAARGTWRLEVAGLVRRPLALTLDDLRRMPARRQRVNHFCVEGWNAVAEWWGVRVGDLAAAAGPLPAAQYVDFQSFDDGYHESWDLESATHPQTLVAYARDGEFLSPAYGAPARLHSPVKLGYKNTKYLTRVVFMAERNGGYWSDQGYEWYGGT